MSPNELISLFVRYGFITDTGEKEEALELIEEDEDAELNAFELLAEYVSESSISLSLGDCVDEDIVEEFMANFEAVSELSDGSVEAKNLKVSPEIGAAVEVTQNIQISFDWNLKTYNFSFSKDEPDNFINGFSKWLFEAFDGDFLFVNDDRSFGYKIPKNLIKELELIGLKNNVS